MDADAKDLIGRLEAATGADRELDCEIALAVDGGEIVWKMANYTMESYPARRYASANHVGGYGNAPVPAYTASIDAALTLVPADWFLTLTGVNDSWHAMLNETAQGKKGLETGFAPTPALAICIAALRAREGIG